MKHSSAIRLGYSIKNFSIAFDDTLKFFYRGNEPITLRNLQLVLITRISSSECGIVPEAALPVT
ncbi:hypothetical protein BCV71DRAFT_261213 [Rhizopus microsporus]|uniref:Uncharacterized protein n=1 Tax=Rhizopus microsporus TaxID=58291 RepID=A0A1X0SAL5_RHIZD|nr:hypothetical protein BCV71DRAFT_261213 [Rhizopus microsporus]